MFEGKAFDDRHVIPRWHKLKQAQRAGEFDSIKSDAASFTHKLDVKLVRQSLLLDFESEKAAWEKTEDLAHAEEVLTSAVALSEREDQAVLSAANAIVSNGLAAPAMAAFAEEILQGRAEDKNLPTLVNVAKLRSEIATRKYWLTLNPRDGLLTAEVALLHLNLGQHKKTESLIGRALLVLPDHPYVLRAAARFWCHKGKPDKALATLRGSERTKIDPWLIAAEMAAVASTESQPTNWKSAKRLVRSGSYSPRSLSELASQIGTFDLYAGARKQGLEMLRLGAKSPTENAVAQIEFIGRKKANIDPGELISGYQESFEASARKAYWMSQGEEALEACNLWHRIEPFSIEPAIFGTFVAGVCLTSLKRSRTIAEAVRDANSSNPTLLNNLAVIHAYMDNTEDARIALESSRKTPDLDLLICHKATEGLIEFRSNRFNEGVALYKEAIDEALSKKDIKTALRAYCILGREMVRIGAVSADELGLEVDQAIKNLRDRGESVPRDVEIIRGQYSTLKRHNSGQISLQAPELSTRIE